MPVGSPLFVLNKLIAALALVMLLLAAPILENAGSDDHSHDVPVAEQATSHKASHSTTCHGATICNLIVHQVENVSAFPLTVIDTSNASPETVLHANRADDFDTPPPRTGFL